MSDVTTTVSETVRDILNKADPNELADALRKFGGLGELLTVLLNQSAASAPNALTLGGAVANTGVQAPRTLTTRLLTRPLWQPACWRWSFRST